MCTHIPAIVHLRLQRRLRRAKSNLPLDVLHPEKTDYTTTTTSELETHRFIERSLTAAQNSHTKLPIRVYEAKFPSIDLADTYSPEGRIRIAPAEMKISGGNRRESSAKEGHSRARAVRRTNHRGGGPWDQGGYQKGTEGRGRKHGVAGWARVSFLQREMARRMSSNEGEVKGKQVK